MASSSLSSSSFPSSTTTPPGQVSFKIIKAIHNVPGRPFYYRIQVRSRIQYLRAPKTLSAFPDEAGRFLGFSTVPDGDWDMARMEQGTDGKLQIVSTEKKRFPDSTGSWHSTKVDMVALGDAIYGREDEINLQRLGQLYSGVFACPGEIGITRAIGIWDFHPEGNDDLAIAQESHTYSLLPPGQAIAPQFIGHITDNGERVIGYMVESAAVREASIGDAELCRKVLAFLIREDGPVEYAQIQHFHTAYATEQEGIFEEEMDMVEEVLQQESVTAQPPLETSIRLAATDTDVGQVIEGPGAEPRVKCDENRPTCAPCSRLGLSCQYPHRESHAATEELPRPAPTSFTLEDLRFHYQFLTVAYPSLPLRADDVWSKCAAMSHSYDFLAHAALGLGASHLSQNGSGNFTPQALQHRVTAIRLVNEQLAEPSNKTIEQADALFAALVCIIAQSSLMPHGMTEYLVMTRGANLVAASIMPDHGRSIFKDFSAQGHMESLSKMINDQPKDPKLLEGFCFSVMNLEPLCQTVHEQAYFNSLVKTITLVPTSSLGAWTEFVDLFMMPSFMNNEDFKSFIDQDNHVGQLLIVHMFLLDYVLGRSFIAPSDEPKCPGRKNMVIQWTETVVRGLPKEFQGYATWLKEFCVILAGQDARYLLSP
ncbi:hypothetical protein G7Z17_g2775 [Cylindrodendrum hubeiense]|uniref:Zn(2)-C6 fungal-type domain-containing protein n=1 Tax=Cylindrodendrum hubeiense TaxID=595255 RepID=A0A9P5HGY0_9HYPO|nr:hypothetical protein G7Z17_g2775 [Cylindrodendrum hubeiense]